MWFNVQKFLSKKSGAFGAAFFCGLQGVFGRMCTPEEHIRPGTNRVPTGANWFCCQKRICSCREQIRFANARRHLFKKLVIYMQLCSKVSKYKKAAPSAPHFFQRAGGFSARMCSPGERIRPKSPCRPPKKRRRRRRRFFYIETFEH